MFPGTTKDFAYEFLRPWLVQPASAVAEGPIAETQAQRSQGDPEASSVPASPPSPAPERNAAELAAELAKDLFGDSNLTED